MATTYYVAKHNTTDYLQTHGGFGPLATAHTFPSRQAAAKCADRIQRPRVALVSEEVAKRQGAK